MAGASVSRQEEINEGLKIFNLLMIAGAYLGLAMCIMMMNGGDNQLFINFCSLLPISAPFVVPMGVLIDKIPMSIAVISMCILVVVTGMLFSFVAKVYEAMIFYNGNAMRLKDILQIAKDRKMADKKGEKQHE